MTLQNKLNTIAENFTFKPTSYMVIQDHTGWTDSYIANLVDEDVKIKGTILKRSSSKNFSERYVENKEKAPKITPILDNLKNLMPVKDIQLDILSYGIVVRCLTENDTSICINPSYLSYLVAFSFSKGLEIELFISGNILVLKNKEDIIGLIMKIRE